MNKRIACWICALWLLPLLAYAQETTLSYDDGTCDGHLPDLLVDSLEGAMFLAEHPATLQGVRLMFFATGPVQIHVWADGGGNDPDRAQDLITPIEVSVAEGEQSQWLSFDLTALNVELPPLKYVHVGVVRQTGGPGLCVDTSTAGEQKSFIYPADEPTVKYSLSDGNYMVQADVLYHDIVQDVTFEQLLADDGFPGAHRMAWGDYNNDGYDDLLLSASKLLRNNGDGSFTDVSEQAGVSNVSGYGMWADYDNDGHLDYYAFSNGKTEADRDRLVHNNGDGTFSPVNDTENVPYDFDPTEAVGWADYDMDGLVDLYVANYEKTDEMSTGTPDHLWRNLGGGQFQDVTRQAGVFMGSKCGRGVAWADFDNDGDPDLYVANYRLNDNFFFVNHGDGSFTEMGLEYGIEGVYQQGAFGHSIGAVWGDIDNDGNLDLVVGNLAHPRFIDFSDKTMVYRNSGPPDYTFTDVRETAGITYSETHSDPLLFDYDNDGWLDLMITDIYTEYLSFLYHNNGDFTFTDVSYETGLHVLNGWGTTAADYDRDGDLDVATRAFFKNKLNNGNHWLQVQATGSGLSNTACIGCRIVVSTGDLAQMREVEGGKGTGVMNSLVQHFGLGAAQTVDQVTVHWTDKTETTLENVAADQRLLVVQPTADGDIDGDADGDLEDEQEAENTIDGDSIADGDLASDGDDSSDGDTMTDGDESADGDMTADEDALADGDTPDDESDGCQAQPVSSSMWLILTLFLLWMNGKRKRHDYGI